MNRKKIISIAVLFIILFNVSAFAASVGVVNTDVLNFRTGPGTGYSLVGQLYRNQVVQVIEHVNNDWSKVSFNGKEGYICKKYINIRNANPVDRSYADRKEVSIEATGHVNTDSLNLRWSPEFTDNVVTALPKYTNIWVISKLGGGWAKVYYNNAVRYVSMEYITMGPAPYVPETKGSSVVSLAKQYLGKPYSYGAMGPDAFDCSGFTKFIFGKVGINLERTTYTQVNQGYHVDKGSLIPGDLVFFKQGGSVNHVGIYIGNGMMIHSSSPGDVVKYDSIVSGYYNRYYYTGRRVI